MKLLRSPRPVETEPVQVDWDYMNLNKRFVELLRKDAAGVISCLEMIEMRELHDELNQREKEKNHEG